MGTSDGNIGIKSKIQLPLVISVVGLALVLGGSAAAMRNELQKIQGHMQRMEQHIASDWTTRDMAFWITFFRNSNSTNLQVPDVDCVKKWGP